jgi:hypothetical protein
MTTDTTPRPPAARSSLKTRGTAVLAATAAAAAVWILAGPVAGAALDIEQAGQDQPQHIGLGPVIFAAASAALLGWGLLALLERFTSKARTAFTITAAAVLLVSLTGPMAGTTSGTTTALMCMHLAVGAALIPLLARTTRQP